MTAIQEAGSDSDSEDGEGPYPFALQQPSSQSITNSLEASLWSLDISSTSASSSMETSDSEVMGWMRCDGVPADKLIKHLRPVHNIDARPCVASRRV